MSLNLRPQLLQVLDDGAVDGLAQVRVLVRNSPGLVSNAVVDVLMRCQTAWTPQNDAQTYLNTSLTQERVSGPEGDLDDGTQLCILSCNRAFDVRNALLARRNASHQHLHSILPFKMTLH